MRFLVGVGGLRGERKVTHILIFWELCVCCVSVCVSVCVHLYTRIDYNETSEVRA